MSWCEICSPKCREEEISPKRICGVLTGEIEAIDKKTNKLTEFQPVELTEFQPVDSTIINFTLKLSYRIEEDKQ